MGDHLFEIHFEVEEAEGWLPRLRQSLSTLSELIQSIEPDLERLKPVLQKRGNGGGIEVPRYVAVDAELATIIDPIQDAGIVIKDPRRGLIDFPHLMPDGQEVFLCWQLEDSDRIEWYHTLDSGFPGRTQLPR